MARAASRKGRAAGAVGSDTSQDLRPPLVAAVTQAGIDLLDPLKQRERLVVVAAVLQQLLQPEQDVGVVQRGMRGRRGGDPPQESDRILVALELLARLGGRPQDVIIRLLPVEPPEPPLADPAQEARV